MRSLFRLKLFTLIFLLTSGWLFAQVPPIRVACVGNSITYGGLGEQSYPQQLGKLLGSHYIVRNFGVGGTTLLKKGDFPYWNETAFVQAQDFKPQILIICLGTNDSKPQNWKYKENFVADYLDLINVFRQNKRRPHILTCLLPPVFQDGYGITNSIIRNEIIPLIRMVRKTARTDSINFYDTMLDKGNLFPDGIHPNAAGYLIMAQIANEEIVNSPSGIIRFFYANAATFEKDESIMLYWEATKNSHAKINSTQVAEFDSMMVSPQQTTIYTLLTEGDVFDTASVTLQYLPPGIIKSFKADPVYIDQGSNDSTTLTWSATRGSLIRLDGMAVQENGSKQFFPKETTSYTLTARGDMVDSTSLVTVFVLPSDQINRALNHPVVASTTARGFVPQAAVDGDSITYWISGAAATQWLYVDLGRSFEIIRIVLQWGKIYGTIYHLQALNEAGMSSNIFSNSHGDGGTDDIVGLPAKGRYVRLLCIAKNIPDSGYVVKEMQVYGKKVIPSAVSMNADQIPVQFELMQNCPNPFNPCTTISYSLPQAGIITLKLYDLNGREIAALVHNEKKAAGNHNVSFDAANLPSGVYLCRLSAVGCSEIKTMKMLLLK